MAARLGKNFTGYVGFANDGTKECEMLRVSFSSMTKARSAVNVLEAYGYSAKQVGQKVLADCPTLLAISAIEKRVGFAEIERLDLNGGTNSIGPAAECPVATTAEVQSTGALMA
jgi:hypothetical protein